MIERSIIVNLLLFQVSGGRDSRPIGAYELAKAVEELGAGEILLNCIDCDGILTNSERLSFAHMLWYFYKDFSLLCSAI